MKYVYILQSELDAAHYYTGLTGNLDKRLAKHNSGAVKHTAKYKPWRIKTYIVFSDPTQATEFETYLKSSSGRAFAKKRL